MTNSNYLFEARTVKSAPIKTCIDALKELITEGNIIFDENGCRLLEMDTSHVVLVHLKLEAADFEKYYCTPGKRFVCGINMLNFNKIIKTIGNDDIISFYQDQDETNELGILIENAADHRVKRVGFKLLDLNESSLNIPPTTFSNVINIPSNMFQKICRDFSALSEKLEIKSVGDKLIFSCDGTIGKVEEVISETSSGLTFKNDSSDEIIQGVFAIKYLVTFTKCSNLCNTVELLIKNNYPLILNYKVASLGEMLLCLAPKENDI